MSTPQPGIFAEGNRYLHALEYSTAGAPRPDLIAAAFNAAKAQATEAVFAFGPELTAALMRDAMPTGFTNFQPIDGPRAHAPATQRDLLVWLHGPSRDHVMDAVLAVNGALTQGMALELDLPGFVYHDSRDLTGFVDGSANPKDDAGKREAALIPDGEPGAGGAIVFSQMWLHDLDKFNKLDIGDQERVIGRTKTDSIELESDAQPPDSHVSRTDLKIDGVAQKMYRRSFPHGNASAHGLYFLAFACEQARFDHVLASMYGLGEDGMSDHLLDFSTPVTGSYWFAPAKEILDGLSA